MSEATKNGKDIDPILIKRFAVFREPAQSVNGQLTPKEQRAMERATSRSSYDVPLIRNIDESGVLLDQTRIVRLEQQEYVVLLSPGRSGVLVRISSLANGGGMYGVSEVGSCLRGRPQLHYLGVIVGLVPDGVDRHPVLTDDYSTVEAAVRHNVWSTVEPSAKS